jgi:hypothetical protein
LVDLFLKSLGDSAPVDDVPDGAEVLSLAVLVLEVVGVLPGVDTEEGLKVAGDGVLVRSSNDGQSASVLVLDEPGPAGALDAGEGSIGLLLESLEGAKVLVDGSQKLALGLTTTALAVGSKVLPEEGVVDVTTAVEVEKRSLSGSSLGVSLVVGLGDGVGSVVEASNVGLVVLGVVKLHDLARDVGLKSAIVVRKVRKSGLATDEAGSSHSRERSRAGAQASAEGGS